MPKQAKQIYGKLFFASPKNQKNCKNDKINFKKFCFSRTIPLLVESVLLVKF